MVPVMTDEHRRKISESNKGKHSDKIWVTNGEKTYKIYPNQLDKYISEGYRRGRTLSMIPWNKGLTKEDPRVSAYINSRKK